MSFHIIQRSQFINTDIKTAWSFFSRPENLKTITPTWMDFRITSKPPAEMYEGLLISYKVRPFPMVDVSWLTEITHVREPWFFVDEQRMGPYRLWHHKHYFEEKDGGVMMHDIVHYIVPYGIFGKIANGLYVKNTLENIFDYRFKAVEDVFGK